MDTVRMCTSFDVLHWVVSSFYVAASAIVISKMHGCTLCQLVGLESWRTLLSFSLCACVARACVRVSVLERGISYSEL